MLTFVCARVRSWPKNWLNCAGVYKVPYPPPIIKFVGEKYQVMKRWREYHGFGEEYNVKKESGSNIIFLIKGCWKYQEGRGAGNFWEENLDLKKNGGGQEYQVVGNLGRPCNYDLSPIISLLVCGGKWQLTFCWKITAVFNNNNAKYTKIWKIITLFYTIFSKECRV